jgi:predicted RNA-binding protein (virulence factor B family)
VTETLQIGRINQLRVERKSEPGVYLAAKDDTEVLLPNAYVTSAMEIGTTVDVFLYTDSEDRLIATTLAPAAKLGEFAQMQVREVASFGAFCDWGLPKDLFVPVKFQKTPFRVGQRRVLRVSLDEQTQRLIGVEKFGKFLSKRRPDVAQGQSVALFILAKTPMGFKAIVNNRFEGMLFSNEIFEPLSIGDHRTGYIKEVREDGKLDLSLRPLSDTDAMAEESILAHLRANDYTLPFTSKLAPEAVYKHFGISKKAYKRALTSLQKKGVLELSDTGMRFIGA